MGQVWSDEQEFYLVQTENTDPGRFAQLFRDVPMDIGEIFRISRNVIEHHAGINTGKIPVERYKEMEIERVEDILGRISDNGVTDIVSPIALKDKVVGNCFNISKLAVSILREKGIPARIRYAYCTYFYPDFNHEQAIVEYWSESESTWLRGDASMNFEILDHLNIKVDIDLLRVSHNLSTGIADVWMGCRAGTLDFSDYGASITSRKRGGLGHVAHKLVHDLACLNQVELMDCDFIAPPKNYLKSRNLDLDAFDKVAGILMDTKYPEFLYSNANIPLCARPRRILRKSRFSGVNVRRPKELPWKAELRK